MKMRVSLCVLWLVFAQNFLSGHITNDLNSIISNLRRLGPKIKSEEIADNQQDFGFSSGLREKGQDIELLRNISFTKTAELFRKNISHWPPKALDDLRGLLDRLEVPIPVMKPEPILIHNFRKLDDFITEKKFSPDAWEIARDRIFYVMNHLKKKNKKN